MDGKGEHDLLTSLIFSGLSYATCPAMTRANQSPRCFVSKNIWLKDISVSCL